MIKINLFIQFRPAQHGASRSVSEHVTVNVRSLLYLRQSGDCLQWPKFMMDVRNIHYCNDARLERIA